MSENQTLFEAKIASVFEVSCRTTMHFFFVGSSKRTSKESVSGKGAKSIYSLNLIAYFAFGLRELTFLQESFWSQPSEFRFPLQTETASVISSERFTSQIKPRKSISMGSLNPYSNFSLSPCFYHWHHTPWSFWFFRGSTRNTNLMLQAFSKFKAEWYRLFDVKRRYILSFEITVILNYFSVISKFTKSWPELFSKSILWRLRCIYGAKKIRS